MSDPYAYSNGVLKNSAGITDYDKLNQYEANVASINLIDIEKEFNGKFDADFIKRIHKHIFSNIYDWAGEYRTVDIFKGEAVLGGISLNYTTYSRIPYEINDKINYLNNTDWSNKSTDQICNEFARKIALLWKIHPFRDGNTRTMLSFARVYAKEHNFPIDLGKLFTYEQKSLSETHDSKSRIRDCFVLASLEEQNKPEVEHLAYVFKTTMINQKNKNNIEQER